MKKKLFFTSLIVCGVLVFCRGQNQVKHEVKILYIIDQHGNKIATDHLIIRPADIEKLTILSKEEAGKYPGTSGYDVVFKVKLNTHVKLLNRQNLLDTFHVNKDHVDFSIQVDGKLLADSRDILAEYAAVSKIEENTADHCIDITTTLQHPGNDDHDPIIH